MYGLFSAPKFKSICLVILKLVLSTCFWRVVLFLCVSCSSIWLICSFHDFVRLGFIACLFLFFLRLVGYWLRG